MFPVLKVSACPKPVVIVKLGSSTLPPSESPFRPITRSRQLTPPSARRRARDPRGSTPASARRRACSARSAQLVLHHHPALHHPPHALELGDVLERIAHDRDEIRVAAALGRSDLAPPLRAMERTRSTGARAAEARGRSGELGAGGPPERGG